MESIFSRLLASLAVCDNIYLLLAVLDTVRRNSEPVDAFNLLHVYFLYPLRNASLSATIYLAVSLAIERYRAIRYVCI